MLLAFLCTRTADFLINIIPRFKIKHTLHIPFLMILFFKKYLVNWKQIMYLIVVSDTAITTIEKSSAFYPQAIFDFVCAYPNNAKCF